MPKGYVVFDLTAGYGTAELVLGSRLPRSPQSELELIVARKLLQSVAAAESLDIRNVRSNRPHDPPDVLFEVSGQEIGLEITELEPENRLERDAILHDMRKKILSGLEIGESTRDWAVTIFLTDDYASKVRLSAPVLRALSAALARSLHGDEGNKRRSYSIAVPEEAQALIKRIRVEPWKLRGGDPRIHSENEPLIVFSAQHTHIVPDRDFPELLDSVIGKKIRQDLNGPTWLLVWSEHYAFASPGMDKDLELHMDRYLNSQPIVYARVFYFHVHGDHVVEFFRDDAPFERTD